LKKYRGILKYAGQGPESAGIVFSGNNVLNIGGSFQLTGGKFYGAQQGTLECNVADDFILKGADFTDSKNAKLNGNLKMKVNGDVIFLNGTFNTCCASAVRNDIKRFQAHPGGSKNQPVKWCSEMLISRRKESSLLKENSLEQLPQEGLLT
jgi:hypothetical protein